MHWQKMPMPILLLSLPVAKEPMRLSKFFMTFLISMTRERAEN